MTTPSASYIDDKVEEIEEYLEEDIDLDERDILIFYDINGPSAAKDSSELEPHDGVPEAVGQLAQRDDVEVAINSGYDLNTQEYFRDQQLDVDDLHLVGELGSVYQINGDVYQVNDDPKEDLLSLKQQLYREAAEQGIKLLEQPNQSNVVSCTRVEGEGTPEDPRGEAYKHFAVDEYLETEQLWEELQDVEGVDYRPDDDVIHFDDDIETVEQISDVIRYEHPFAGVRFFTTDDGRLGLYRDRKDNGMNLEDAHAFMDEVLEETAWDPSHNPDFGTDYIKTAADPSKEKGANALAQHLFDTDDPNDYVILHVGDKPDDVMEGDNAVFFAQSGMPATDYCEDNGIDYIEVENAVDYSHILDNLLEGGTR